MNVLGTFMDEWMMDSLQDATCKGLRKDIKMGQNVCHANHHFGAKGDNWSHPIILLPILGKLA
jgi:hypothetical protein